MEHYDLSGSKYERINKTINLICNHRIENPTDFFGRYRLQEVLYDILYGDMKKEERKIIQNSLERLRIECNNAQNKKVSFFNSLSSEFERELFAFAKNIRRDD